MVAEGMVVPMKRTRYIHNMTFLKKTILSHFSLKVIFIRVILKCMTFLFMGP